MVKPPKAQHSRPRKNPVTIDLTANAPVRDAPAKDESPKSGAGGGAATSTPPAGVPAGPGAPKQEAAPLANDAGAAKPFEAGSGGAPDGKPAASAPTPSQPETPFRKDTPDAEKQKAEAAAKPTSNAKPAEAAKPAPGAGATAGRPEETASRPKSPSVPPAGATPRPDARSAESSAKPIPAARSGRGMASLLLAGVAGGMVALLIGYGLQTAGVLTGGMRDDAGVEDQALDSLRQEVAALRAAQASAPEATTDPAVTQRLDQLSASVDALNQRPAGGDIDELAAKVAALESRAGQSDPQAALAALEQRLGTLEQAQTQAAGTVSQAQSERQQIEGRVDEVEQRVSTLAESIEGQPRMALAIAATALKAAVDRGDPFGTELETYTTVAPEGGDVAALSRAAQSGIPTREAISAEAGPAAEAIVAADTPAPQSAGLVDRLMTSAKSLVAVRPVGEVEGEGVPAVAARMEAATKAGDYDRALTEYDALPDAAKQAGAEQAERIRARRDADRALDQLLAGALKPAPAPAAGATGG